MAVTRDRDRRDRPPLDPPSLEQAALGYAGRYATSRAKLRSYLERKVRERGWAGEAGPDFDALIARMASLGYVDDRAFAMARAASLSRRGYGERKLEAALRAAGVSEEDRVKAKADARESAWAAALRFAERRKIGPFAALAPDRQARDKAMAALLRAGHPLDLSRLLASARPGEIPDADSR